LTNNLYSHANHPIAVFDSGVGGLSIMRAIHQQLPNESLIYVADTAYAPYGDKSDIEIQQRINEICTALIPMQIKALVIACNTATVNAIDQLREQLSLPIIGVEPAIKPAVKQSKNQKIGLLVTQATANNRRFQNLVATHQQQAEVIIQPCPGLVQLIEQGLHTSAQCTALLTELLTPLKQKNVDTIVLGCTHYPFVANTISKIMGSQVTLIETAIPVANEVNRRLRSANLLAQPTNNPTLEFFTTQSKNSQQSLFGQLWQSNVTLNHLML
jgi:glutamate racemase